jgi:hypothetical protein
MKGNFRSENIDIGRLLWSPKKLYRVHKKNHVPCKHNFLAFYGERWCTLRKPQAGIPSPIEWKAFKIFGRNSHWKRLLGKMTTGEVTVWTGFNWLSKAAP